ncbi:MAG: AAA family ATPase, partial [Planctomycetota bacterium]
KTELVKALATLLGLSFRRLQFTPDLMPGDVTGGHILEDDGTGKRRMVFHAGPVFTNVLLADEINRASPRTQSALLEAMAEQRVKLFGENYPLEDPFFLVATENPIEMEGTFPLPEAQLDRFQQKVVLGRPSLAELVRVLDESASPNPTPIAPVMSATEVRALRRFARELPVARELVELVARTVLATHPDADAPADVRRCVRHGASPRAGQSLLVAARARALLRGRLHVTGEDLDALCAPVLRHRLLLGYEGEASGADTAALARSALAHARSKAP